MNRETTQTCSCVSSPQFNETNFSAIRVIVHIACLTSYTNVLAFNNDRPEKLEKYESSLVVACMSFLAIDIQSKFNDDTLSEGAINFNNNNNVLVMDLLNYAIDARKQYAARIIYKTWNGYNCGITINQWHLNL